MRSPQVHWFKMKRRKIKRLSLSSLNWQWFMNKPDQTTELSFENNRPSEAGNKNAGDGVTSGFRVVRFVTQFVCFRRQRLFKIHSFKRFGWHTASGEGTGKLIWFGLKAETCSEFVQPLHSLSLSLFPLHTPQPSSAWLSVLANTQITHADLNEVYSVNTGLHLNFGTNPPPSLQRRLWIAASPVFQ